MLVYKTRREKGRVVEEYCTIVRVLPRTVARLV